MLPRHGRFALAPGRGGPQYLVRLIKVLGLAKHYKVHRRPPGVMAAFRSIFRRHYQTVRAVDGIDFEVAEGERVGFLGPNGAGKTTTLKMLSGLLHPTTGSVSVDGHLPQRREPAFLKKITLVMGQKQQLLWDLPPSETFALNRAVYDIPRPSSSARCASSPTCSNSASWWTSQPGSLSGERMKCELAAALLHLPRVLFLDEPTIGLDVSMQATVRRFVRAYNERYGATVLLTSHYMEDVLQLCPRVIVIDRGRLAYDGDLRALSLRVRPDKRIVLRLGAGAVDLPAAQELARFGKVVSVVAGEAVLQVRAEEVSGAVAGLLAALPVADLTVEDPPLEEVFAELFRAGRESAIAGEV